MRVVDPGALNLTRHAPGEAPRTWSGAEAGAVAVWYTGLADANPPGEVEEYHWLSRETLGWSRTGMQGPQVSWPERPSLVEVLTEALLREMAGEQAFERGRVYFEKDRVSSLHVDRWLATAEVQGTETYSVRLWVERTLVQFHCTCPACEDGWFCKHCVAVGLAIIEQGRAVQRRPDPAVSDTAGREADSQEVHSTERPADLKDVSAYLAGLDKTRLVDMILTMALHDERLRRQLSLEAARARAPSVGVAATLRRTIDELSGPHLRRGDVSARDLALSLSDLVDELNRLCDQGHAAEVVELAERALDAGEAAIEFVDDSDGVLSGELDRLQAVHHKACEAARPDPVGLARRLFDRAMHGAGYTAFGSPAAYADVLGEAGLEEYRRLANAEWERVPALGPGQQDERFDRYRLVSVMEELAELSGDVEALVAVKRRDLSTPGRYLAIAETYQRAGQLDKALEWAEAGLEAFGPPADGRLRGFVADVYHRLGRRDEAMALVWAAFAAEPGYGAYRELRSHAERAGQWDTWRDRALNLARERLGTGERPGTRERSGIREEAGEGLLFTHEWGDSVTLTRILLSEGLVDEAWEQARRGGCSEQVWLELAARREREHPGDAVKVYQAVAELLIARTHNRAYEEAVEFVGRVRALMERMGRQKEFRDYLTALRARHGRKRNLMKLLAAG